MACYIIGDDPGNLTFKVAVDDALPTFEYAETSISHPIAEVSDARHAYLTATVKVRLYQRAFREKVLDAYKSQCSFCRLKHRELLDAASHRSDNFPEGKPVIENGISLCKYIILLMTVLSWASHLITLFMFAKIFWKRKMVLFCNMAWRDYIKWNWFCRVWRVTIQAGRGWSGDIIDSHRAG